MWGTDTRISTRSLETNLLIEIVLITSIDSFRSIENSAHVWLVLNIQLLACMLHYPQAANTCTWSISIRLCGYVCIGQIIVLNVGLKKLVFERDKSMI